MPFTAPSFDISQGVNAGQQMVSPLQKALQKYEEDKKKTDFNQGVFDIISQQTGPNGEPYIPVKAIERWHSMNPDAQAGVLSAAGSKIQNDMAQAQLERQNKLADATANLTEAKAYNEWTGSGPDASLQLTPDEIAQGEKTGKVPLRTSGKSFMWAEDPNNPANMGQAPPSPIKDPRDPTKIIGLQDARGGIKYFPKASTLQEAMDMGLIPPPASAPAKTAAPPASTTPADTVSVATPAEAQTLAPGTRYKTPDGRTFIR